MHPVAAIANIAAVAAATITAAVAVTIADTGSGYHTRTPVDTVALIEDDDCHTPHLGGISLAETAAQPGTQQVTVTVPAIAVITYTPDGYIDTVMTNTGCAPQPDHQIWHTTPAGLTEGTWADIADTHFTGDFTNTGTAVPQHHADR